MSQTICNRIEHALERLMASSSVSASAHIYRGLDNDEKMAPAVILYASDAREEIVGTGIWRVTANIQCRDIAPGGIMETSDGIAALAYKTISDAGTDLANSGSGIAIYDVYQTSQKTDVNGDAWASEMSYDYICVLT